MCFCGDDYPAAERPDHPLELKEASGQGQPSREVFQVRPGEESFDVNAHPMVAYIAYQLEFTLWAYFPGSFAVGLCKIHLPFAINGDAGTRMSQSRVRGGEHHQCCDHECCFCFHGCAFAVVQRMSRRSRLRALGKPSVLDGSHGFDDSLRSVGQQYLCSLGGIAIGSAFIVLALAPPIGRADPAQLLLWLDRTIFAACS
jgi:hypothetical protein